MTDDYAEQADIDPDEQPALDDDEYEPDATEALWSIAAELHDLRTEVHNCTGVLARIAYLLENTPRRTPVAMATAEHEAELVRRYGKTADELADEAERGYDVSKMRRRDV